MACVGFALGDRLCFCGQLADGDSASAAALAAHFDLPQAYLAKHLASLVRAGVLTGTTGPRGGFRLARPAAEISMLDIVDAVDGGADPYLCREIRQQGRGALPAEECEEPCILATIMRRAHEAWRTSLASCTLADIIDTLPPEILDRTRRLLTRESA